MRALVLAYHSHNVAGGEYRNNDHIAFTEDLRTLATAGARFASLDSLVDAHRTGSIDDERGAAPMVAITFDDGPVFDVHDFTDRRFGPQTSFLNAMLAFAADNGRTQPGLQATSFVIASREARAAMESDPACGFGDQGRWLTDAWWPTAQGQSLLRLGNHSWDHVHPAVRNGVIGSPERGNFAVVDNYADASREIREARVFIESVAGTECAYFAYPYGHWNPYLASSYFPEHQGEHGARAAFTTEGRRVQAGDSRWMLPRAVCGHHWKSGDELLGLLFG